MIFVTVGTHEQQFDRLIKYIDELKRNSIINEEVRMQIGFSTYEPKHCYWKNFMTYKEIESNMNNARIIITHGGPSSFIMALQIGKIPIVVPRMSKFYEHVNNHQVDFVKVISERKGNIISVYEIQELKNIFENYERIIKKMQGRFSSNNERFCEELENIVEELM